MLTTRFPIIWNCFREPQIPNLCSSLLNNTKFCNSYANYSTQLNPKPSSSKSQNEGDLNKTANEGDGIQQLATQRGDASKESSKKEEHGKIKLSFDLQRTKREQMRKNVEGYVFERYFNYVKNYDKVLEKNFPKAMGIYRAFFDGVRDFFADMKLYLKISRIVNESPSGIEALNRWELELYHEMPRAMWKVAPALIGCSLPFVGYAFFPLVFMYPRQFLTAHFWTPTQRVEFKQFYLQQRLLQNMPVFRCLQSKLKTVSKHEQYYKLSTILGQLGSGFHPTSESLLEVKDIFAEGPLKFDNLSRQHIRRLIDLHGLSGTLLKRFRLEEYARILQRMDIAITREGGAHNLPIDALQQACYRRGLNPIDLTDDEMLKWLRSWIEVSKNINEVHTSLLLHLPILLGYNHPNNWKLIHTKKS